jgi:hypothetical protein
MKYVYVLKDQLESRLKVLKKGQNTSVYINRSLYGVARQSGHSPKKRNWKSGTGGLECAQRACSGRIVRWQDLELDQFLLGPFNPVVQEDHKGSSTMIPPPTPIWCSFVNLVSLFSSFFYF